MRRVHRSLVSCSWALTLALGGLAWSCAQGVVDDTDPAADATLPDLDASWTPKPTTSRDASIDASKPSKLETPTEDDVDAAEPEPTDPPPTSTLPAQGEVLITEVMYDPTGTEPASEWIELFSTASSKRTLSGLTLVDGGGRKHVIGAGLTIDPGAYVVLVRNQASAIAAKVPASAIVYEYGAGLTDGSGVQLANGATGSLELRDGSTPIAQAFYGGWFSQSGGKSIQLKSMSYAGGSQSSSWCLSNTGWTAGSEKGTPGAASDCP